MTHESPKDRSGDSENGARLTPVMRQYWEIKEKYPDTVLFFRIGDFYETFESDAELISRELEIVLTSRSNVYKGSTQIAVARIVSDCATFAWLCDVFVDENSRGRGIGTWLAESVVKWAEKNGIKRIILATRDAHEVYSRAGFELLKSPERWMAIDRRPQARKS